MRFYDPYKCKMIDISKPTPDSVYLTKLLNTVEEKSYKVLKWFIQIRLSWDKNNSKLWAMNELINSDTSINGDRAVVEIGRKLIIDWNKKGIKEDERIQKDLHSKNKL